MQESCIPLQDFIYFNNFLTSLTINYFCGIMIEEFIIK